MFDTLDDILRGLLDPIGNTGRNIILVVGVALLVFTVIMAIVALSRQRFGAMLLWIVVSLGVGILSSRGYEVVKSLGDKQGDDFEGQINALFVLGVIPTYLTHLKYKRQLKKSS
ncbi:MULTISPECIES: hypothetical protein [Staphylococcus]|mgnify:CR=1 FL=1|uniref:hypothetical protein n=1 Tax=Staphylococcus TaxID=1279 RepID=UPI000E32DE29|nr:hypothetical protein [Staphylococcus argenteus]BBD87534.1 hypothetical protein SA58113_p20090 [Staphylococcus argenteus]